MTKQVRMHGEAKFNRRVFDAEFFFPGQHLALRGLTSGAEFVRHVTSHLWTKEPERPQDVRIIPLPDFLEARMCDGTGLHRNGYERTYAGNWAIAIQYRHGSVVLPLCDRCARMIGADWA